MTASPLIIPVARFFSVSGGAGLAGGKVYTYEAGTNTPKATYTSYTGGSSNTNPVILDSSGSANIWLIGNYKINLLDSNNVQQANYPVDGVSGQSTSSDFYTTTGTANNYVLTPAPTLLAYAAGNSYKVLFNVGNSGPSTINISGLGPQSLVIAPSTALSSGNLLTGIVYEIVYDGTNFQVLNPTTVVSSPPILIQMGFQSTAPTGYLSLNGDTIAKTSGGTVNGAQYSTLYAYLWNNTADAVSPVAGGRGANAAADFAANKTITLPDRRDYSPFGVSIAGSITTAGAVAGATTVTTTGTIGGTVGTSGATTLSTGEIAAHTHTLPSDTGATGASSETGGGGTPGTFTTSSTGGGGSHTHTAGALSATYTGNATSVLHKVFGVYWYINY